MEFVLSAFALFVMLHLIYSLVEFNIGYRKLTNLAEVPILPKAQLPFLSIIFSALNEEETIEKALTSLLSLDYPNYEVIAIDDRSTDNTPKILDRLQKKFAHLRVYHIKALPEDWLGKNHALHFAAQKARGSWFLFTDADVSMKKETATLAMSYVLNQKIDHLTIYEHHIRKSFWLKILLLGSYTSYSTIMKPWRIRYRWSKKSLGHGAFNLVKADAYWQTGGHRAIAMECLDDLMLGRQIKMHHFKQDTINGGDFVEREWYTSATDMINGLKKNGFAYFNFALINVFWVLILSMLYYVWPIVAVICCTGLLRWLNAIDVGLLLIFVSTVATQFRMSKIFAFFYPISIIMINYAVIISAISTFKNKGIIWRETHYSIEKLKYKNARLK